MTIDDAIKHEEDRATDLESTCTLWKSLSDAKGLALPSDYEFCKRDAEDHRQVAAWLKELKVLKETPKGDLISRSALNEHKFIIPQGNVIGGVRCGKTRELIIKEYQKGWNDAIDSIINNVPTVSLPMCKPKDDTICEEMTADGHCNYSRSCPNKDERPQGEWLVKSNGTTNHYACNKCGNAGDIQDKFCRNCGVKMKRGSE